MYKKKLPRALNSESIESFVFWFFLWLNYIKMIPLAIYIDATFNAFDYFVMLIF